MQDIPQNEVIPDQSPTQSFSAEIPQDEVVLDKPQAKAEIPSSEVVLDRSTEIPQDEVIPDDHKEVSKYGTPVQQAIAGLEGASRGATFGLSTGVETGLGLSTPEEIEARAKENPLVAAGSDIIGTVASSFVPGVGEGWLLGKAAKTLFPIVEEASALAKIGRLAARGAIESMGMASGNEISDAFLDKGNDAEAVANHLINAGAIGVLASLPVGVGSTALKSMQDAKLGEWIDNFAIGIGKKIQGPANISTNNVIPKGAVIPEAIRKGEKFYEGLESVIHKSIKNVPSLAVGEAARKATSALGEVGSDTLGLAAWKQAQKWVDPMADKLASKWSPIVTKKVLAPIMLQALKTGQTVGLVDVLKYGSKSAKGADMVMRTMDSLFKTGSQEALNYIVDQKENDKLDEQVQGGIQRQLDQINDEGIPGSARRNQYAEGGAVHNQPNNQGLANLYPAQHMMLEATKGRVLGYLGSIKPQPPVGNFVFDKPYEDTYKKKDYQEALSIANQPLMTLKGMQDGTLLPDQVKHLKSMYPEVYDLLSKKLTERLTEQHMKGESPNYKLRQGLSMFLGSPLDSTFSPQSIQAAQMVFAQNPLAQPQGQGKSKSSAKDLAKDAKLHRTTSQTAEADRSARK